MVSSVAHARSPSLVKGAREVDRLEGITSLHIHYRQDSIRLIKEKGEWLTLRDGFPVEPTLIRNVLAGLMALETKVLVDRDSGLHSPIFGLTSEDRKQIEWKDASGKVHRVLLGNLLIPDLPEGNGIPCYQAHDTAHSNHIEVVTDPDSTYWRLAERSEVYCTPGNPGGFPIREEDWKDRSIFPPFVYENVQTIATTWLDSTGHRHHYTLVRTGDTSAALSEPHAAPVPRVRAAQVFVQTSQFAVDAFVDANDTEARAMADSIEMDIRITLKNGLAYRLRAGKTADGFRFVRHPRHGRIVKVADWRFDFFRQTRDELVTPVPSPIGPMDGE